MALATRETSHRQGFRPSLKGAGMVLSAGALVWGALAVQAAIVGERHDTTTARLERQIAQVQAATPAQAQSFTTQVSDQAKTQPFDATLPPATSAPVKEIVLTATDDTVVGIAKDINFTGWTFGGTVPAKPLRVRQGDTVKFTLVNNGKVGHSMDFHAASINPGSAFKTVLPGQSFSFEWKAINPGVYMFHCGTPPVIEHIGNGMYGAIIVDPPDLAPVDREFVFVQSELYTAAPGQVASYEKMLAEQWDAVVFNGYPNQYATHPIRVEPGQRVRVWVMDDGPSENSSFHIVGTIFDTVFKEGHYLLQPGNPQQGGSQALDLQPAQGGFVEFTLDPAGLYPFVTHKFSNPPKGATGIFQSGDVESTGAGH